MKLTLGRLTSMKPGAYLPDPAVEGLRLHKRANGRTFAEYRFKGALDHKWHSIGLGRVPGTEQEVAERVADLSDQRGVSSMSITMEDILGEVREAAREKRRQNRKGADPFGADTLRAVVATYLAEIAPHRKPRTLVETTRHLTKDWAPLHPKRLMEITADDVDGRLDEIEAKSGPVARNRARAALRALFQAKRRMAPINPADLTDKRREHARDRVLSLEELRAVWKAAGDGDHGAIVRLLMLTGQRREEVGGLRWSELDLEGAMWSLPGDRPKNGKPHLVPLSKPVVAILTAVERQDRENVFGNGAGSFSGWSRSKKRLDKRAGVPAWTLHDLRRSWATHVNEHIAPPHVVEATLNHVSGVKAGVAGIYNRAVYLPERREAMQRWADWLLGEGEASG